MTRPAILIFIKAPRPGAAKTRLTPFLSAEAAAQVAVCLARDAALLARRCLPPGGRLVVAYAPDDGWPDLERALSPVARSFEPPLIPMCQTGENLGERMAAAVGEAFDTHGFGPVVLLGADCPLLPPEAIHAAFQRLGAEETDVILGPAEDGGYYLIGLRAGLRAAPALPLLFADVAWSTETVCAQTVANAERLGLRVSAAELPPGYDIDTPADLVRLRDEINAAPALAARAPSMARWLHNNAGLLLRASSSASDADEHP